MPLPAGIGGTGSRLTAVTLAAAPAKCGACICFATAGGGFSQTPIVGFGLIVTVESETVKVTIDGTSEVSKEIVEGVKDHFKGDDE